MKTLILALSLVFAASSQAQSAGQPFSAKNLSQLFYAAQCDQQCQADVSVDTFQSKDLIQLPEALYFNLRRAASDQAQIWGDTILEGDYSSDGRTQLDKVVVIRKSTQVIGYLITYSEHAWYTGDCDYNYDKPSTLRSCQEGRIQEASFVSMDFKSVERDQNQFADFQSND